MQDQKVTTGPQLINSAPHDAAEEASPSITLSLPPGWKRWLVGGLAAAGLGGGAVGKLTAIWDTPGEVAALKEEVRGLSEKMDEVARVLAQLVQETRGGQPHE